MEVQNVTGAALHVQHGHVHWLKDRIGSALVTSRWCDGQDRVSIRALHDEDLVQRQLCSHDHRCRLLISVAAHVTALAQY